MFIALEEFLEEFFIVFPLIDVIFEYILAILHKVLFHLSLFQGLFASTLLDEFKLMEEIVLLSHHNIVLTF